MKLMKQVSDILSHVFMDPELRKAIHENRQASEVLDSIIRETLSK